MTKSKNEFRGGPIIVGVDPGATTGVCVMEALGPIPAMSPQGKILQVRWGMQILEAMDVPWDERFMLLDLLPDYRATAHKRFWVVCEDFKLYPHMAAGQSWSDFPSVKVIGLLQTEMHMMGIDHRLIMQPASSRKSVQILDEYKPALVGLKHAKDAYRHARYYILTKKKAVFDEDPETIPGGSDQPSNGDELRDRG